MHQWDANQIERTRRYEVRDAPSVEVTVERMKGLEPAQIPAKLLDLSVLGVKLALDSPLQFMESVALRIRCEAAGIDERLFAQVRWVRPGKGDQWLAGCGWESALPQEMLDRLGLLGAVQRRQSPRFPVDGAATVWWGPGKAVSVRFLDLSEGGFCLGSPEPGQGAWLRVVPTLVGEQHVQIVAQLRWQKQVDDGYLLGCKFVEPNDFATLQQLLCHPPAGYRPELKRLHPSE